MCFLNPGIHKGTFRTKYYQIQYGEGGIRTHGSLHFI
jgi:hypothetical protein